MQKKNVIQLSIGKLLIFCIFSIPQLLFAGASITVPSKGIDNISTAIMKARSGDTIWVQAGIYKEHITLVSGVTLVSRELFKAVIDGKSRGDIVTMSYNSTITGFSIRNGNAGIISRNPGNIIHKCKIYKNRGSGIICTGNLPKIENNVIVFNEGSAIQALDITSGNNSITHNTIAFNGNNGIVFNGSIKLTIENNIISSNGSNGIKLEPGDKKTVITHNNLFANYQIKFSLPENNFSFHPLFTAPKRKTMDFTLKKDSKAIKRGNDTKNLGALFTY